MVRGRKEFSLRSFLQVLLSSCLEWATLVRLDLLTAGFSSGQRMQTFPSSILYSRTSLASFLRLSNVCQSRSASISPTLLVFLCRWSLFLLLCAVLVQYHWFVQFCEGPILAKRTPVLGVLTWCRPGLWWIWSLFWGSSWWIQAFCCLQLWRLSGSY